VKGDITMEIIRQQVCEKWKWSEVTKTIPLNIKGIDEKINGSRRIYDSAIQSVLTASDGFEELR
jgi:hypothetical protein